MSRIFVQNKYNEGDIVFAKVNPTLQLVIRRYVDQIYYCKITDDPEQKELVYFERELIENQILETENKKLRDSE